MHIEKKKQHQGQNNNNNYNNNKNNKRYAHPARISPVLDPFLAV